MLAKVNVLPVVKTHSANLLLIDLEAQRVHQMKTRTDAQTKTTNVARVWTNLWIHKRDVERWP
jgi:hypothetical protein